MGEIHRVIIQIRRPTPTDPGQVSEGFYVIQDGVLIMTHGDGEPVSPDQFRHTLKEGDNPAAIAGILTRKARLYVLGLSESEERFGRSLQYPNNGIY